MKKIWIISFVLVAVVLLVVRFVVIEIIMTSDIGQKVNVAGNCPNRAGLVLVNRLAYGYPLPWNSDRRSDYHSAARHDWTAYHRPATEQGESDDKGPLLLGKVTAGPGDTLWYNNEDGLIANKPSTHFCHPLIVPGKGKKLNITDENIRFYAITIMLHEPSKVCIIGDSLCVSGNMVEDYTFTQDYYWLHNADTLHQPDSRSFGFIPHKSLVGKVIPF